MDPVAGAFQNYGDEGHYKNQWGGVDSLDEFYKKDRRRNAAYGPGRILAEPGDAVLVASAGSGNSNLAGGLR